MKIKLPKTERAQNVTDFFQIEPEFRKLIYAANMDIRINPIGEHGQHWMLTKNGAVVANFWPVTKHVQLLHPVLDFTIADHLDGARSAIANAPIGAVEEMPSVCVRANPRRESGSTRHSVPKCDRIRNNAKFEAQELEFRRFAASLGISVRTAVIGTNSVHVMLEKFNGVRLANFWPATMRVSLGGSADYFYVTDMFDAVRSANSSKAIGALSLTS